MRVNCLSWADITPHDFTRFFLGDSARKSTALHHIRLAHTEEPLLVNGVTFQECKPLDTPITANYVDLTGGQPEAFALVGSTDDISESSD